MCQRRMGPKAKLNNEAKRSKCVCKKGTDGPELEDGEGARGGHIAKKVFK